MIKVKPSVISDKYEIAQKLISLGKKPFNVATYVRAEVKSFTDYSPSMAMFSSPSFGWNQLMFRRCRRRVAHSNAAVSPHMSAHWTISEMDMMGLVGRNITSSLTQKNIGEKLLPGKQHQPWKKRLHLPSTLCRAGCFLTLQKRSSTLTVMWFYED